MSVNVASDPRYREGLAHLQVGAWDEAKRCFRVLLKDYPESEVAQEALNQVELRANLDASGERLRPKQFAILWLPTVNRVLILVFLVMVLTYALSLMVPRVLSTLQAARREHRDVSRREECRALSVKISLGSKEMDQAQACWAELLTTTPEDEEAKTALVLIGNEREILGAYEAGVARDNAGDCDGAVSYFMQVLAQRSPYADTLQRIRQCKVLQDLESLLAEAETHFQAGRYAEAQVALELVREGDISYQRSLVEDRLYETYLARGRALLEQDPPSTAAVTEAVGFFEKALRLRPRDHNASQELELAELYLRGEEFSLEGAWDAASQVFQTVYSRRPGYLRGLPVQKLYEALLYSGEAYAAGGDCNMAYARFEAALKLPVDDSAAARAGMSEARPCLTPTRTPTPTPTPSHTPTPSPTLPPTSTPPPPEPTPTPTPWDLSQLKNKILFRSDDFERPGLWFMDPNGANRTYLYENSSRQYIRLYEDQYKALRAQEAYSPDGRYRVYTTEAEPAPQVWMMPPPHPQYGVIPPYQCTYNTGLSYDPVWSPDGGRIAFVSQENGTDDIWIINPGCDGAKVLTKDEWKYQWEKHPTFSPDSRYIAYFANPYGHNQIHVMNADGGNVRNISNNEWNETDPIWIK